MMTKPKLFERGEPIQDVAQRLIEESSSEKVKQLCKFIRSSKRGIPFLRKETHA